MSGDVYVAGVGMMRFGRHPERSLKSMAAQAAFAALDDAGLRLDELDACFCANAYAGVLTGQESIRGETWLRAMGGGSLPVINIENACASGSSALHLAHLALLSGQYRHVLVIGAEKMFVGDTQRTIAALGSSADLEAMSGVGLQFAAVDAIRVLEVMEQEGLGEDDLNAVTVKAHRNGALNPYAQYQKEVTAQEVAASRMIAEPLRLLMCSAISDGAAAVVLSTQPQRRRVRVRASVVGGSPVRDREGGRPGIAMAAERAYRAAGVEPGDLDVIEVHDAVSPAEFIYYRELGLCAPGEVARFAAEGAAALDGRQPVNPSGGLNSRGHPVAATGLAQIAELTWQLRGEAGPRQVREARLGLAHNSGGWIEEDPAVTAIHILERV